MLVPKVQLDWIQTPWTTLSFAEILWIPCSIVMLLSINLISNYFPFLKRPSHLSGIWLKARHFGSFSAFEILAQMVKNLPAIEETQVQSLGWKGPLGEGNGNSLLYSCLENSMDRGAWQATDHGVSKSWTLVSDFKKDVLIDSVLLFSESFPGVKAWVGGGNIDSILSCYFIFLI